MLMVIFQHLLGWLFWHPQSHQQSHSTGVSRALASFESVDRTALLPAMMLSSVRVEMIALDASCSRDHPRAMRRFSSFGRLALKYF